MRVVVCSFATVLLMLCGNMVVGQQQQRVRRERSQPDSLQTNDNDESSVSTRRTAVRHTSAANDDDHRSSSSSRESVIERARARREEVRRQHQRRQEDSSAWGGSTTSSFPKRNGHRQELEQDRTLQFEPAPSVSPAPASAEPSGYPTYSLPPIGEECGEEPYTCRGSCGDCDEPHDTPGCSCEFCECAVCTLDAFCCDFAWDEICAFGDGETGLFGATSLCGCGSALPSESPAPTMSQYPSLEPTISTEPSISTQPSERVCDFGKFPLVCDGACGDCNEIHDEPGCTCFDCECVVCLRDPFCCANSWDLTCSELGERFCDCGSAPPSLSPVPTISSLPSLQPSISEQPTAECKLPYTCDGSCGDCNQWHAGPGCSCQECQCFVCEQVPQCCEDGFNWFGVCPALANLGCECETIEPPSPAPTSPAPTDECTILGDCGNGCNGCDAFSFETGCEACPQCQCQVCQLDSFCCETQWDRTCAELASLLCDCVVAPTSAPTQECGPPPYTCDGNCGDCHEPNLVVGACSCEPCACEVCRFDDFCCNNAWDQICADAAQELCECGTAAPSEHPSSYPSLQPTMVVSASPSSMPTSPPCEGTCGTGCGFCFLEARYPGCSSCEDCAAIVCERPETAYCCELPWDAACAAAAQTHCECCLE